jgi:sigma-B regulation protein RsbU (phosphoserine phosphatase)
MTPEMICSMDEVRLAPGDVMVWYTDGLTEASDQNEQEFGTRRLLESVRQHSNGSARELCDQLWQDVSAFSQRESLYDDLTVIVVKMKSASEPATFPAFSD